MPIEGTNKYNSGKPPVLQKVQDFKNIAIGQVIEVIDPQSLGRIKVSIKGSVSKGGDDSIPTEELAWCFPMVPKFFASRPNVGEAVLIFTFSNQKSHIDRLYLGPIISQSQYLPDDQISSTALSGFEFGHIAPSVSINTVPEIAGVFPSEDDISVQGRDNADITFKHSEVLLRAGKFVVTTPSQNNPFNFTFNNTTQAYIQIKDNAILAAATNSVKEVKGSVTNIVANKINLLTHKDGSPLFSLTNQTNLISDEELLRILDEAHQLPFGDILLEYLRLLKEALFNHVHNGNGNKATDLTTSGNKQALALFKKKADALENQMLSKNIRIN